MVNSDLHQVSILCMCFAVVCYLHGPIYVMGKKVNLVVPKLVHDLAL